MAALFFAITFVGQVAAQTCVQPPSGLVSWWDADSVSETTAFDIHGDNNGTLVGGVGIIPGKVGNAFSFDGIDDYVIANNLPSLGNELTMISWVKSDMVDQGDEIRHHFVSKFEGFNTHRIFIDLNGDFKYSDNRDDTINYDVGPWGDVWHMVSAVIRNGATSGSELYFDGSLVAVGTVSFQTGPGQLTIGAFGGSNATVAFFGGAIDEVQVFNRALLANEIQAEFNAGSAGKCKTQSVLINIHPGSDPNSINLCSNGAVPIAILGSDTFDVNDINTETLRFAEAAVKVVGKKDPHSLCSYEDVNGDFISDLVCHFVTQDIAGVDGESTSATVNGELLDGTPIEGTDSVNIVKDTCN